MKRQMQLDWNQSLNSSMLNETVFYLLDSSINFKRMIQTSHQSQPHAQKLMRSVRVIDWIGKVIIGSLNRIELMTLGHKNDHTKTD